MKTEDPLRARVAPTGPVDHLSAGHAALGRGDWQAARLAFEAVLQIGGTARSARGPRACRLVARFGRSSSSTCANAPTASTANAATASERRAWRCGWRGTPRPSAASTRSPTDGCSVRTGCSTAVRTRRSTRGSPCAAASLPCSTTAIRSAREELAVRSGADRTRARRRRLRDGRPRAARLCPRDGRQRRRRTAGTRRGQRRGAGRRDERPRDDRPRLLLPDCGLRAHPRLRARGPMVRSSQGVLREVGLPAAVRGVPHAVRVRLHVARRVGRGRTGADVGVRRARGVAVPR